ncbi:hypothetical protein EVAR_7778_1 [Eumeta japonica]|uniref:Uncharacterized protein n=1 Tax=Eumeta variegata TaxID=151549 RepID=A0A4C1TLL7_EUMVA|nr:hypothetical protein EVAR_7778_1 [Eumeta japonica]
MNYHSFVCLRNQIDGNRSVDGVVPVVQCARRSSSRGSYGEVALMSSYFRQFRCQLVHRQTDCNIRSSRPPFVLTLSDMTEMSFHVR